MVVLREVCAYFRFRFPHLSKQYTRSPCVLMAVIGLLVHKSQKARSWCVCDGVGRGEGAQKVLKRAEWCVSDLIEGVDAQGAEAMCTH